jgi:hypothetical protein
MDLTGFGSIADLLKVGIEKIWPDPADKAKAQAALLEAQNAGLFKQMDQDFQLALEQIKTNAIEAASPSMFVAGWRPAVGWVGAVSLGMVYIPKALTLCSVWVYQAIVIIHNWDGHGQLALPAYPDLGITDLLGLLGALLGIGTMRTIEKTKGVLGTGH